MEKKKNSSIANSAVIERNANVGCTLAEPLHETRVSLKRVELADYKDRTPAWNDLLAILQQHSIAYPNIIEWAKSRVGPTLSTGKRYAYIAYEGVTPRALAIAKAGKDGKICHLSVDSKSAHKYFGTYLIGVLAWQLLRQSKQLYFTLPEELWGKTSEFFNDIGFRMGGRVSKQYRKGQDELMCASSASDTLRKVIARMSVMAAGVSGLCEQTSSVLASVNAAYAESILRRTKTVEVRTRFSKHWIGHDMWLYGCGRTGAVCGYANIANVVMGSPSEIWNKYSTRIGCSEQDFSAYTHDRKQVFAIELADATRVEDHLDKSRISALIDQHFRPPQSYKKLDASMMLSSLFSIARCVSHQSTEQLQKPNSH